MAGEEDKERGGQGMVGWAIAWQKHPAWCQNELRRAERRELKSSGNL